VSFLIKKVFPVEITMIWVIIAVIIAGWMIAEGIHKAGASQALVQAAIAEEKLKQEKDKRQADIDAKYPPESDGFKLIKLYMDIEVLVWHKQQTGSKLMDAETREMQERTTTGRISIREWEQSVEELRTEFNEQAEKYNKLKKQYNELRNRLGYEASDILVDNWPETQRLRWEQLEGLKTAAFKRELERPYKGTIKSV